MGDKWITKVKGSKPFKLMIGITAILTALITFTDAIENISNKLKTWSNNEEPQKEAIANSITNSTNNSRTTDSSETHEITVISAKNTPNTATPPTDEVPVISPKKAFKEYNNMHITSITDFSDAISISKDKLILDLSVLSQTLDTTINPINDYHINKRKVLYEINPSYVYLKNLAQGKLASNNLSKYNLGLPVFDIKAVNNSDESVFITKAIFKIKKSIQDKTPYFKKSSKDGFTIPITNIGHDPATNVKLKLSIKDSTGVTKSHEINIDTIKKYCSACDVSEILKDYNVDVNLFKGDFSSFPSAIELKKARGAFKNTYVPIEGVLTYQAKNINGQLQNYSFTFSHQVKLDIKMDLVASMMSMSSPSNTYDLKLNLNDENYVRTINVSQVLSPKGFDRFQVKLYADAASRHLFDLTIVYNDGQTLVFENLALNYFKPKSL